MSHPSTARDGPAGAGNRVKQLQRIVQEQPRAFQRVRSPGKLLGYSGCLWRQSAIQPVDAAFETHDFEVHAGAHPTFLALSNMAARLEWGLVHGMGTTVRRLPIHVVHRI